MKSIFMRCSPAVFAPASVGESRFSGADKEAEHVMKQPANMKECVSDTIQLLSGHRIPNEMGCVTCDWCDVLMCGSWEELLPFSPSLFLGGRPPPASPRSMISLVSNGCGGMWLFWLIGLALRFYPSVTSFGS